MSTNFTEKMNLEEYTKCYICMGKLAEATMCPHCNKLSCNKCIQKWLADRKSSCPYCRMSLKYSQIVHCRFINDLTSCFKYEMIESISNKKPSNENCNEHKIPLLYYCNQCLEPLCSDCFMFSKKHKDHDIKHLDLIYKNHLELIKNETKDLQGKLDNLNHILSNIEEKITILKHAKQERSIELDELFENLKKKLDSMMREKLLSLIKTKTLVSDKIEDFDKKKIEINKYLPNQDRKLADSHHGQFIANSDDYIKILKALGIDEDIFKDCLNISVNFESDISPPYESTIFTIKEYKKLLTSTTSKDILYSTELNTNGLLWRLKIYPNGNGVAKGEYISIFLELIDGLVENSKYFYKIELCNYLENKPNYSREFSSDFHNGECWGYNRFYKIDLLEKEGYLDPISGNLNLKYYVKPLTYSQLCRDQKAFIEKMEKQLITKQQNRNKKEKEKLVNEKENLAENKNITIKLEEVKVDNKENSIEKNEVQEINENRLDIIDPENNNIVLNIKDQNYNNNNQIDLPEEGDKLNINDLITINNVETNTKLINELHVTENKEIDDENLVINKTENLKSSTNLENIVSKNREIDESLFLLNDKKNLVNYQQKEELNFKINYAEDKHKKEYLKMNEIEETKQFKSQEEEKLDFVHQQDRNDLSSEFNIVSRQNGSSDMSLDMFDKQIPNILNDDSLNFFKENIKLNAYANNFTVKQEYEDPFSKKLNLKTSNSSVRKDTTTENRINDMMTSLFPETTQRNQTKVTKPSSSMIDIQTLHPSSMSNNNSIFEKNKFNNYEKLRYILKENKLKSCKKNNK